jgi:outer membrane lipoprotein carrier protein
MARFSQCAVGFIGKQLAAVEIVDSFGQRSLLQFSQFEGNVDAASRAASSSRLQWVLM